MARLERGNYVVEILQGSNTRKFFWYYIIQRSGSNEIIDLVKFETYELAIKEAHEALEKLNHSAAAGEV